MTAHLFSRSSLLLVNPMQSQWFSAQGDVMAAPTSASTGVKVVADLIEETHVAIEVPGLFGRDRSSYIAVQYQSVLPDVTLRSVWEKGSTQPLLPRPFRLHAVGLSSPALTGHLDELVKVNQPIEGVWTLSYLMAHWAARQVGLPSRGWLMLCLGLPYGMRMVLLHDRVPVFSRLLLEGAPVEQAQEVGLTLKYLADNRVIDRDVRPAILPMDPAPELRQGLQGLGLNLLPSATPRHAHGMLAEVLAVAGSQAPGQLASVEVRRHHLAHRTRQGLYLLTSAVALAGLAGLILQGKALLGGADQSRAWQEQATQMVRSADAIRHNLAQRDINVPLLRLAIEVQQKTLKNGIDPTQQLWMLGQLMAPHPQAQLLHTEQALREEACAAAQDPAASTEVAAPIAPPEGGQLKTEWQFEIRPNADLQPSQRQALLASLAQSVAAWSDWQVKVDPVRLEGATALAGGQGALTERAATGWRWCLTPRAPAQEGNP